MTSFRALIISFIFFGLNLIPFYSLAKSQIHFSEYKILLTEKDTSADYRLFNQGDTAAICSTKFIDYMIQPDGRLVVPIEGQAPENSGVSMLRASPRQVVVPANGSQRVKVIARGMRKRTDGEWHSYLSLRCKDKDPELKDGINLMANFVYNIPVTIRKGQLTATVEISGAQLMTQNNTVWVETLLNRQGDRSIYGNFTIVDANGTLLGELNGVSHYLQATQVPVKINLSQKPIGRLDITFTEDDRFGGDLSATYSLTPPTE
jgi:hypothetical protein